MQRDPGNRHPPVECARGALSRWALVALLGACAGPSPDGGIEQSEAGAEDISTPTGSLLVSAAASLTDAFEDLASTFEAAHPDVEVALNLAGTSTLRAQILEGAPVDVFASADHLHMDRLEDAEQLAGEPGIFARNRLRIAVPPGNPGGVRGLEDFEREELLVGICAASVPCGALAREALSRAGVIPALDTEEPDVRALLTKVELGELDAALVYVTDVHAAGGSVDGIDLEEEHDVVTAYPIAVLRGAPNPRAADAFVAFTLSAEAWPILARHGFGSP